MQRKILGEKKVSRGRMREYAEGCDSGGRGEEERCRSVLDVRRGVERWSEGGGRERGGKEVYWREERSGGLGGIERKRAKKRNR